MKRDTFMLPKMMPRDGVICALVDVLEDLPNDKTWRVRIEQYKSSRTNDQNNYLNGVVYRMIGDALGSERDEVSELMCAEYWGWREKEVPKSVKFPTGIEMVPVRTTTIDEHGNRAVLGKTEFSEYWAFCHRWAAKNLRIVIPDPDPDYKFHREEQREEEAA